MQGIYYKNSSRDYDSPEMGLSTSHGNGMPFLPLLTWEPGEMLLRDSELMH